MAIVLALGSALIYGVSDFVGGLLSRRTQVWSVAFVAQVSSAACTLLVALVVGGRPTMADASWGAVAGVGTAVGSAFLYRGLASGRMTVVAPLSAVGSALLPVAVGVVSGERPAAFTWLGVVCAFPAIWLVSRSSEIEEDLAGGHTEPASNPGAHGDARVVVHESVWAKARRTGVVDGLLAGLGFGTLFAGLGQVGGDAELPALAVAQVVSLPAIVALATILRAQWWPTDREALRAVIVGPLGAAATGMFLFATQLGLLSVSAVLSSLYPASTVLLAAILLHERIHRGQAAGLALAAVAVSLVALDS
ncbi:MAG: EamA family transporter [Propionibacteriales bacterium]|nr:EamA family transporter [Propionibacteriales bacterium]